MTLTYFLVAFVTHECSLAEAGFYVRRRRGPLESSWWNLCGTLQPGTIPATLPHVNVHVNLPDDLVARIDDLSTDRSAFVAEAIRRALRESDRKGDEEEIARINEVADELNREAEDILEYQALV